MRFLKGGCQEGVLFLVAIPPFVDLPAQPYLESGQIDKQEEHDGKRPAGKADRFVDDHGDVLSLLALPVIP
jgi:hypothetical protein